MVQFHSPPEASPRAPEEGESIALPDVERDPFPPEEPTRPSTPSSLHPYRSPSPPTLAPVVVPTSRTTLTPGLVALIKACEALHPPQRPVVEPWWRAIVRLVLGD